MTVLIIGLIVGIVIGIPYAYHEGTKICPFCGHKGESVSYFPLCPKCGRDRRDA